MSLVCTSCYQETPGDRERAAQRLKSGAENFGSKDVQAVLCAFSLEISQLPTVPSERKP